MNAAEPTREDQEIDQLLADTDGTIIASNAAESTVGKLRSELATLELALQQSASPDPYQKESACVRAVELVAAMGRDAESVSERQPAKAAQELGELGPYQLLDWLGQGGMGTVYKALHSRLDKLVAIKVLPANRLKNTDALGRFQREMKAVGKVDHPHLVRALDAGEANGTHYLVMELVSGTDLGALLKQRGPLPVADACELIVQAASGLQAAHSRGMVHRDIKPANLMLAVQEFGPPVVKVLDLGLALLADAHDATSDGLTGDSQIMGTIDYMAPEQAENSHSVDVRADVYSLGATLYALLTGGSIFADRPNQTLIQKLSTLANEAAAPIRSRCGAVSESLANIVHRMLSRKPGDRFASMAEVIAALQPFTAGSNLPGLLATDIGEPAGVSPRTIATQISGVPSNAATEVVRGLTPLGSPVRSGTGRAVRVAVAAAIAGIVLLGAILLSIKTPSGDVVVEIPDDLPAEVRKEIKVSVTGDGAAEVASEANGWKVGVKEGKYHVELTGGRDQVQLEDKQVTVSRKKQAIVTITMKPLGAMAANGTKPTGVTAVDYAAERRVAEWVFGVKGQVAVRKSSGELLEVKRLKELPQGTFTVTELLLCVGGNFSADEITNDDCRRFAALSGLEKLDLGRQPITAEGLAHFSGCRELKHLYLYSSGVGSDAIPIVAKFTKLESFMFQAGQSDAWAEAVAKLPALREVTAYRCDITDAGVAHLARLPKLEKLVLSDCGNLTDASLQSLATCKSLKSLTLFNPKLTSTRIRTLQLALPECQIVNELLHEDPDYKFATWLKSATPSMWFIVTLSNGEVESITPDRPLPVIPFRVDYIGLHGVNFAEQREAFLAEFAHRVKGRHITGIDLASPSLTSADVASLVQLPELSELTAITIASHLVDDTVFEALARLAQLKHVSLTSPKLTGRGLRRLSKLTHLAMFDSQSLSLEAFAELAQFPEFDYFQTGAFHWTEQHVATLAKLKLAHLLAEEAGIDDALLARFAEMQSLRLLHLKHNPITDAGLPELKKLKNLDRLVLNGTKVTAAGVADLQQALPNCKIEWDAPKE